MYFYSCSLNVLYSGGMASYITDLVDTYAPELKDTMGSVLDMTRYEGQLYGVAAYRQLNSNGYFTCRSDALETAGVLELAQNMTTWAEFEQVLAAVTEKSGMYGIGGGDSMGLLAVRNLVLGGTSLSDSYFTEALGDTLYLVNCAKDGTVSLAFENPDYIEMCKMIARWHSAGYIWPDTAFNGENKYALVSGGVYCGVIGASEYGIDTQYSDRIGTGSFVRELAPGVVDGSGAKNIGVFVPVAASEPEAAIKLINLFWTNETLMNLIDWGIEGRSYVVNDSGEAAYPEGLDAVSSGYHMNDYMFGNQFLTMPWSGSGSDFRGKALENFLNSRLSAFMGITVDVSSLSGEITAIKAARDEYYTGITSGYYTDKLYQEFMDKLDAAGAVEAMMFLTGKLLFVPISGAINNTARWDTKKAQSEDYHIDLLKNASEESLEFAVHQYYSNGERLPEYETYDSFLSSIDGDFKKFLQKNGFSDSPALSAAWLLWTNIMNTGYRKNLLAVIPGKLGCIAAVGWQQALFSLAFSQNPRIGKRLILDYLGAQIENGPLPQSVADIHINTLHSTAPLFGYALEKNATLLERCSPSELRRIYDGLSSNTDWWLSRWNPRELRPAYFHPKEAGAIADSYAMEDLPVMTPDLLVWLIFQCDACGRLSSILSISGASKMWANCAEILLELLKNELWDGLHFCALSLNTGKKHPIKSISRIIPMLLHKRLGDEIFSSLKEDLLSSFLTERGISSFEKDSPTDIDPAVHLMFALLFHEAGDYDLFARILAAQEAEFSRGTQGESSEAGDEPLTSLSAACCLAMRRMGQSFGQ